MLAKWRALASTRNVPELFDRILKDLNYKEHLDDDTEEGEDRWENVQELRRLADGIFHAHAGGIPRKRGAGLRPGHHHRRQRPHPADAARRQGTGVRRGLHRRSGRRHPAAQPLVRRARGNGGGTPPVLRGHHPRQGPAVPRPLPCAAAGAATPRRPSPPAFWRTSPESLVSGRGRTGTIPGTPAASRHRPGRCRRQSIPRRSSRRGSAPGCASSIPCGARASCSTASIQDGDEIVDVVFESVGIKRLSASLANLTIMK